MGNRDTGYGVQGVWAMGYKGMEPMGHRGYGVQGVWAMGHRGSGGMGHMGNEAHWGYRTHGQ